jgi:hypothetical protein
MHLFQTTAEMVRLAATKRLWDPREVDPPKPVQSWGIKASAISDALFEAREKVTSVELRNRLVEAEVCREIAELTKIKAKQEVELADTKANWSWPRSTSSHILLGREFTTVRLSTCSDCSVHGA